MNHGGFRAVTSSAPVYIEFILLSMGDEILLSSIGIIICQYKDLYEPMVFMECFFSDFERCSVCKQSVLAATADVFRTLL